MDERNQEKSPERTGNIVTDGGDVDVGAITQAYKAEARWHGPALKWLGGVSFLTSAVGTVLLILAPFVEEVSLLDATCVFVIGVCVFARYWQLDNIKTGNERFVIWCRLLREIRDAVKESKGDNKDP